MEFTKLKETDILPLTCTRLGTCCFDKRVMLNPWEIRNLMLGVAVYVPEKVNTFRTSEKIQLSFHGELNSLGQAPCSLYKDGVGCTVHEFRPLSCRLYPLGRIVQMDEASYIFEGEKFPCFKDCSGVLDLPQLSVQSYLLGQQSEVFEEAQDFYLNMTQNLADLALTLLLDTDLKQFKSQEILTKWKYWFENEMKSNEIELPSEWILQLIEPDIQLDNLTFLSFSKLHEDTLFQFLENQINASLELKSLELNCHQVMTMALILAKSIGANEKELLEFWIETARAVIESN